MQRVEQLDHVPGLDGQQANMHLPISRGEPLGMSMCVCFYLLVCVYVCVCVCGGGGGCASLRRTFAFLTSISSYLGGGSKAVWPKAN